MIYIKSFIAGIAALILSFILYDAILLALALIRFSHVNGLYYDELTIMSHFWFVSLPVAIVVFAVGFWGNLRRAARFWGQRSF